MPAREHDREAGRREFFSCPRRSKTLVKEAPLGTEPRLDWHCGAPISDPARFGALLNTCRIGDRRSGGSVWIRLRTTPGILFFDANVPPTTGREGLIAPV